MDNGHFNDIDSMSEEELKKLKKFLFEEQIRIQAEEDKQKQVYEKLAYLKYAPIIFMSVLTGKRVSNIFEVINQVRYTFQYHCSMAQKLIYSYIF